LKIAPTDIFGEERPVFSFEPLVPSHMVRLYHQAEQ
jgi:hypothetical protein